MGLIPWPLKTGDDNSFHKSQESSTIYGSLGEIPRYDYNTEVHRYSESKWRRGMLQNVVPAVCYGGGIGFVYGLVQARQNVRHVSRPKVVFRHTFAMASIGLTTRAVHQFLVVQSNYRSKDWHALVSGMIGGVTFAFTTSTGVGSGVIGGFVIGVCYTGGCYALSWYQRRALQNFLITQQAKETPVHRVAPELQPMYRAFLFDHRPIEESDELRRRSLLLERTNTDTRLDAQATLEALNFTQWQCFSWMEFPEWWPLRFTSQSEQEVLAEQRARDDNYQRRLRTIQDSEDRDVMTRYLLRSKRSQGE